MHDSICAKKAVVCISKFKVNSQKMSSENNDHSNFVLDFKISDANFKNLNEIFNFLTKSSEIVSWSLSEVVWSGKTKRSDLMIDLSFGLLSIFSKGSVFFL